MQSFKSITTYAVPLDEPYFAAGRAEDSILFTKMLYEVQHFCEKEKYHAAAGDAAFWWIKRLV